MAAIVAGAAGPTDRDVTIDQQQRVLTIFGSPEVETLTISGRSSQCCITIEGNSFSEFSDDCDYSPGGFTSVECDTSKMKGIEAPLGDSGDLMTIAGRMPILTIRGQTGEDRLIGGDAGETLQGGEHDDRIRGGGGRDDINGGSGVDRCKASQDAKLKNCEN